MAKTTKKKNRIYTPLCAAEMLLFAASTLILALSRFKAICAAVVPLWCIRDISLSFDILMHIRRLRPDAKLFSWFSFDEAWDIQTLSYLFMAAEACIVALLVIKGYAAKFPGIWLYSACLVFSLVSMLMNLYFVQDKKERTK